MPTTKNRINITLSRPMQQAVAKLAQRDQVPQATKVARLLETALELEEDQIWDKMAQARDVRGARYISHTRAWQ